MKQAFKDIFLGGKCPYVDEDSGQDLYGLRIPSHITFKDFGDGFAYFEEVRYLLQNDRIIEYNIDFYKLKDKEFELELESFGSLKISHKTRLCRLIHFLKYADIGYEEYKVKDKDYFVIRTEKEVNIYFDLQSGRLYRMGKMFASIRAI
jgi:hypothetical protein